MMQGLQRGFQLILDFFTLFYRVVEQQKNIDAVPDFMQVIGIWITEATGFSDINKALFSGQFNVNKIFLALGLGSDPFKSSRQALQALKLKYGGK